MPINKLEKLSLPKYDSIRDGVNRKRLRETLGDNKHDDICEFMKSTLGGERFLWFDDGRDTKNRIIIWTTVKNLNILANSVSWVMYGSFKTCKPGFSYIHYMWYLLIPDSLLCTHLCQINSINHI
jgi:hypothetical protein